MNDRQRRPPGPPKQYSVRASIPITAEASQRIATEAVERGQSITDVMRGYIDAGPDMLAVLRCMFEDERFQVGIGGNPIVVQNLIDRARGIIEKMAGSRSG